MADLVWNDASLINAVDAASKKNLERAAVKLVGWTKIVLSVPAPRRRVMRIRKGIKIKEYIATTPATPGAPPRKLSGRLRASITNMAMEDGKKQRVGTVVKYARPHEKGNHRFIEPTLRQHAAELGEIIAGRQ